VNPRARSKRCIEADLVCPVTSDRLAVAAVELPALRAASSPQEVADEFIVLLERPPVTSKHGQISGSEVRATTLAELERAISHYQISVAIADPRRVSPDFLRQFRDLKKWPTKQRLKNILERDRVLRKSAG
jgi:hypothetical protein